MELVHQLSTYDSQGRYLMNVFFLGIIIILIMGMISLMIENYKIATRMWAWSSTVITTVFIIMFIQYLATPVEPRPRTFSEAYTIIKHGDTIELKSKKKNQKSAIVDLMDSGDKTYTIRYKGDFHIIPKE